MTLLFAEIGVTLAVCLLTFPLGSHVEIDISRVFCQSDPSGSLPNLARRDNNAPDFWRLDAASSSIISVSVVPTAISEPRSRRLPSPTHVNGGELPLYLDAPGPHPAARQHTSYCTGGSCPLRDFLGTLSSGRFSVLYLV